MSQGQRCSVDGCDKLMKSRGFCIAHYRRWQRNGDPVAGRVPNGHATKYLIDVVLAYEGDECMPWPFNRNWQGYGYIWHGGQTIGVHRLVCKIAHGPPPSDRHDAAHSCGRGHEACITKRHLSWKTKIENQADRIVHGTMTRGTAVTGAKLTEAKVLEIRAAKGTATKAEIASQFGVSKGLIKQIHGGTVWSWLE